MLLRWAIHNVFNLICSMMNDYQSFKIMETKSVFYTMTREIPLVVCLNLISGISFSIERRAVDWMSTGLPIEGQIGNQASKWRDDRPHSTERLTLNLLSAITQRESWKCAKKMDLLSTIISSESESAKCAITHQSDEMTALTQLKGWHSTFC